MTEELDARVRTAGLCASCACVRLIESARGSTFFLCARSTEDARYVKYPRLPVLMCPGFVRADGKR